MNLAWLVEHAALERPEHPAVIECETGEEVTYAGLRDRVAKVAGVLRDHGVGPDDIVVTLMPDDAWHVALFFASMKLGGVFTGFNRILSREKFAADIERMRASTIVVSSAFVEVAEHLRETTCLETILVCDEAPIGGHPDLRALASVNSGVDRVAPRTDDDIAAINYTGGTSGVSKGVIFTHGTLGLSARLTIAYQGMTRDDRNLSFISLYHSGGIHDAVTWAMATSTNIVTGGWSAPNFSEWTRRFQPTWIKAWVPTMVRDAMKQPDWDVARLEGVHVSLGGEPVPGELRDHLRSRGMRVTDTYGLTESMPWAVFSSPFVFGEEELIPSGSCGRPLPEYCDVVLKDPATGVVIDRPHTPGEICIRGGVVSPGYYNDQERTAAARDDEGYFHTRDVAYFDDDGWYYIRGRVDDIINSGGEKISLIEIENLLKAHEVVRDAACVGVAHERFGEIPAAIVVAEGDIDEEALAEILDAHLLTALERWKRPRLYVQVEAIPRTLPKRTKDIPALRAIVRDVRLADAEGVTTLGRHLARIPAAS
jgi:acyl-CoA synthetase (AMP-forming)/AMP-acid ligase II